jgi:hypothetical protein
VPPPGILPESRIGDSDYEEPRTNGMFVMADVKGGHYTISAATVDGRWTLALANRLFAGERN